MKVRLDVLKEYFSFLLVEGRVDDAREKFPDMEEDIFEEIVANQPAGSNNKYLMWSCLQVDKMMEEDPDPQAVQIVIQAVRLFDGNQQRLKQRDLNQYKDIEEVETAVAELGKSKGEQKKQIKADTETIYEDDRWLVVRPYTTEASCKYGVGSKWCIAATGSYNYFTSYSTSNNKFYFVIDKKGTAGAKDSKYAIAITTMTGHGAIQVYDASDKLVSLSTVASLVGDKWGEIWKKIEDHVKKNPKSREVEEAEKAVEEHVKSLLKGEKLSDQTLQRIAKDAKLTTPIVKAIFKSYENYTGPSDYRDPRQSIASTLANRAADLSGEAATLVIKWIASTKPEGGGYWSGRYNLEQMLRAANFQPADFRELAKTEDESILANIFTNPHAPEDLKSSIAEKVQAFRDEESRRKVYWELIKSGKITEEQMRHAMSQGRHGYNYLGQQILDHPGEVQRLPPNLIRLIPVKDAQGFKKLLELPNVPPDYAATVLTQLIQGGNLKKYDLYQILRTVPLGTTEIEQVWRGQRDQDARTALLQNPAIGAGNATKFAASKNSAYRFAVAHNTVTPAEALQTLAADESVSTRAAVAANPSTPAATLTQLAADEAVAVRASVASNTSTPRDVLEALKKDSDDFVRKATRKTLKSMTRTEAFLNYAFSMRGLSLLTEELEDEDETPDVMNPSWRDLPTGDLDVADFIAVYLLQNNGHATREEIQDAYQDWRGSAGFKELWHVNRYSDEVIRGSTAGGKGWYWSPPGIQKGALFRLTPAGAAAALKVLRTYGHFARRPKAQVTSATARAGKTYYTPMARQVDDITGYQTGEITMVEVEADYQNRPIRQGNKYNVLSANRTRRQRRRTRSTKIFKYTSPAGEVKFVESFPKVQLPGNAAVQFVKTMYGVPQVSTYNREQNQAIVKRDDRYLLVPFPLWTEEHGTTPERAEPEVMPPVRKSPPPRELTGAPAAPRAGGARGPKTTYKIYGRHRGAPAHTRLKGQAYAAPADTEFRSGEQAGLTVDDDGKLKVKKVGSDHEQTWEPVEG